MSTPYVGEIRLLSFPFAPVGWMSCNGQLLPVSQYDALFSLLGTTYGGDGQTTFALPDLRGRVPVGFGQGPGLSLYALGETSGSETVTLLASQMPAHSHTFQATTTNAGSTAPASNLQLGTPAGGDTLYATDISGVSPDALSPTTLANNGGNLAHDNVMPTLTASFCIAVEGIYPSHS